MEFVHDDGGHVGEVEGFVVEQSVEQDFGDDDEHGGLRVDLAIAGDESDIVGVEAPPDGGGLHFGELLFGERDERGGVIGPRAGHQGFVERRFGDERLAGSGGGAHEHALFGREIGEQRLFLHRVRRIGELFQVCRRDPIPRPWSVIHVRPP